MVTFVFFYFLFFWSNKKNMTNLHLVLTNNRQFNTIIIKRLVIC